MTVPQPPSWESRQDLSPLVGETSKSQQYFKYKEAPRTEMLTRSEDGDLVAIPGLSGEQVGNWLPEVVLNSQQEQGISQDVEIDVFPKLACTGKCPKTDSKQHIQKQNPEIFICIRLAFSLVSKAPFMGVRLVWSHRAPCLEEPCTWFNALLLPS